MVTSVEGVYRNGKVELAEPLAGAEGAGVTVTWVHSDGMPDLRKRGIDESQAAESALLTITNGADDFAKGFARAWADPHPVGSSPQTTSPRR